MPALSDRFARKTLNLAGYRSRHVPTSVGQVHLLDARGAGRLPPLVLLHGFSSSCVHYFPLLSRLRGRVRRLVVPDAPAHGFSEVPAAGVSAAACRVGLREALDAVIDEPVVLFGNSMGGAGAIEYAAARPEKIRGLVLCSPGGAAMDPAEIRAFVDGFRLDSHADALDFMDRVLARPSPLRQVFAWGVRRKFGHPDMRALLASITPEDLLKPEQLRSLEMPVFLMWGRADRIFPQVHLDFFRQHLPTHARVEEPEQFGHSPFLEHPDALTENILAFMAGL